MIRRTSMLAALFVLGAAAPVAAQQARGVFVPGFEQDENFKFGISKEQVNAFWRETPDAERREGSVVQLDYDPWQHMNWTVMVHDTEGLVGLIATSLPTNPPNRCGQIFDALVRGMNQEMAVTPTGQNTVARGTNVCQAVASGQGQAGFHWRNPSNGVGVSVWVEPHSGRVHYVIGTSTFRDWAGQGRDPLGFAAGGSRPAATAQAPAQQPSRPAQQAQGGSDAGAPQASANARNLGLTPAALAAIRPGMSLEQVTEIIGRQGRRADPVPGVESVLYVWEQPGQFKQLSVSFLDGRAFLSSEIGLYGQTAGPVVTLAQFQRLREGMTLEEVNQIMGGPGQYTGFIDAIGRVSYGYRWRGRSPGSTAAISFYQGRMTAYPLQVGLQ